MISALEQLAIPDYTAPAPEPTNYDRFMAFHSANPHVYESIRAQALAELDAGATRLSMRWIIESCRRNPALRTERTDEFKVNNNHQIFYRAMLERNEPRLAGLFGSRERAGE